jgi:hypothetical protein
MLNMVECGKSPPATPQCPWRRHSRVTRTRRKSATRPHYFKRRDTTFDTTQGRTGGGRWENTAISLANLRLSLRRGLKTGLFKENPAKTHRLSETIVPSPRLTCCMKKILLLSAVLLGAVTASQAGVRVNIGIGIPLPGVVIAQPAPVFVAPPPVCAPPPVVVVAPPPVYYGYRPGWYGYHGWAHHRGWHQGW